MRLAFSTVDREPQYVHATLGSMRSADPLCAEASTVLCVCGTDAGYLAGEPGSRPMTEGLWAEVAPLRTVRRIRANFLRVLDACAEEPDGEVCFAFQDDLRFAPSWLRRGLAAFAVARERLGEAFLLNLCVFQPRAALQTLTRVGADTLAKLRRTDAYYGNQALAMSPRLARQMSAWIRADKTVSGADDMATKAFCVHSGVTIVALLPSPVDHVGERSTWTADACRSTRVPRFG